MFIGQFVHTLDDKSRIALPAKFRTRLEDGVVMTAGTDGQMLIYPRDEFEKLAEKVNGLPLMGPEAATLRRMIFVNAADAVPDKQGRVVVPEPLLLHMGITDESTREAVIVGVGKFIEVWSTEAWQRAREEVAAAAAQKQAWANLGI